LLIPCSKELVGSNPTPRALNGDSDNNLFSSNCRAIHERDEKVIGIQLQERT
jgi:hypothetical protein